MKKQLLFALVLACTIFAANAGLKDATIAMSRGDWKVLRSSDAMTDKTDCTGIYNDNYRIQLTPDRLFIGISGGIQSVTLRFDDNPPGRFRLATDMEKKLRSITLSGSDFSQLRTATRLRYQTGTLVSGVESGEINLTDFQSAHDNILQGCPLENLPSQSGPSQAAKPGTCEPALIKKMKDQGLQPDQILSICA